MGMLSGEFSAPPGHLFVIETGRNGHDEAVAWIFDADLDLDMNERHEYQSGSDQYLEPGAEEPVELPWGHWPHVALGVRS